jgi:predicted  nucleic acid-binding Zn-ribbon protein
LELAKSELKSAQVRVAEAELEVKARNDKILALKQNQSQLKTNKEFQAYNLEIAKIEGEIDNYEARQIAAMDDVTPRKQTLAEREAALKEGQQAVDAYCSELDARMAEVQTELTALGTARGNAIKQVQPRALSYYERLSEKRWPVVVPLQADGVCKGCNLRQPPSVAQMVRRNQELTSCQMCGRVLYL